MLGSTRQGAATALGVTLTSVALSLALSGCGGGANGQEPKASHTCPPVLPAPTKKIAASTIYVNIVNASNIRGKASKTATQLTWRGYHILGVGNLPLTSDVPQSDTAEIHYGTGGKQIALTLATQVKNPVLVDDQRSDPTVDLIIADKFALVPVPPPSPSSVTVNVYNTTFRAGLAGQVSGDLTARGFKPGKNGNDPLKAFLPDDTALIRYGERGEPAARRVALQFKGARLVQDGRTDTTIDVVLGNKFTDLVPQAQATPAPEPAPARPAGC